jgi:LmbE family N-acetylglucosaminyl deacetylase
MFPLEDVTVDVAAELGAPDDQMTHLVDTTHLWQQRWTAIRAHRSQTSPFEGLPDDLARAFLCREHLRLVPPISKVKAHTAGRRTPPTATQR